MKGTSAITRRSFAGAGTAFLASTLAPRHGFASNVKVNAAYQKLSSVAGYFAAKENKFFEKEGIALKDGAVATNILIQSVISGQYDFGINSVIDVASAYLKGGDVRVIYPAALVPKERSWAQVVVPLDSTIRAPEELAGKKIAVHAVRSYVDGTVKAWLKSKGINPAQVTFVPVGAQGIIPAIRSKQVDAAFTLEPQAAILQQDGLARVLGSPAEALGTHLGGVYIARESWLDKNPDTARAIVRALDAGTEFVIGAPSNLPDLIARNCDITPEIARRMNMPTYARVARKSDLKVLFDTLAEDGVLERNIDPCAIYSKYCPQEGC